MRFISLVFGCGLLVSLVAGAPATPEEQIRSILEQQVAAWNRGDLEQFVSSYAAHCMLVGGTISETTREQVLAHYRDKYPSPESRGKLDFSGLAVRRADAHVAIVTGHWHLDREKTSGGPVGGVFSLVFELIDDRWQITLDHTS